MEEITAYKCSSCGRIFELKSDAEFCESQHEQLKVSNKIIIPQFKYRVYPERQDKVISMNND